MKVLYAASEAYPFAMSGGLADVAYALPKALRRRLVGCRIVMPLYDTISKELRDNMKFSKQHSNNFSISYHKVVRYERLFSLTK